MARFGHTITPIGKDKAILFGGAVGDTGIYLFLIEKENMLLQVIHLFVITIINDGKNSNLKVIHHQIELHMHLYVLIIISLFLVVH